MSYPNFSYYNGPSAPNEFWSPTTPSPDTFTELRSPKLSKPKYRNPWTSPVPTSSFTTPSNTNISVPANQSSSIAQNYAQNMILPSTSRTAPEPVQPRHEVLQGKVTQLFSNFGYINDDIIFSICDVMGPMVQVGDKVAVDATFQPNNPTKYKGERVCKIDDSRFSSSSSNSNFGKMKTLTTASEPRVEFPTRNRLDKSYDDFVSPSPRIELPLKNRLGDKYDNGDKYDAGESSLRVDTMPKNRMVSDKYNVQESSPRTEAPIKSRLGKKFETAHRSTEKISSYKRSDEAKEAKISSIKNKVTVTKEKPKKIEIKFEKPKVLKRKEKLARKAEAVKQKVISPIKAPKQAKAASPLKRKSESNVKIMPKLYENFASRELDSALVKIQLRSLTVPPEFFHVSLKYQQSFPLNHPMKLGNNCHFKVMDKRVKSIDSFIDAQLSKSIDPEDADTTFVAKVMLLSTDDLAKFYKDTLTLAEEFDGDNKVPITKAIKFLVGSVGENKEFGIGGAWSPSLDGVDPERNPRVLINTAIRTCKATTGIDLSNCSSWPKFLELRYYRPMQRKTNNIPNSEIVIDVDAVEEPGDYSEPRMETVVYFIPDVWNCVPSQESWNEIKRLYQEQLTCIMCPPPLSITPISPATRSANSSLKTASTIPAAAISSNENGKSTEAENQVEEEDWNFNETEEDGGVKSTKDSEESSMVEQPTHYSKLVVGAMKIVEIKKELELRKLNNRGVMEQLKARLKAALDREENEDKNKDGITSSTTVQQAPVIKKVPDSVLSDSAKNELKKVYALPDRPEIIVHQNKTIFTNQIKIRTMSLHSLLSYYNVTLQENTFELAVFAKQFLEMMKRDAAFNIYKSIVVAQDTDFLNSEDSSKKPKLMVTTSKRTINRPLLFSCSLLDRDKTNKISLDDLKILIEGLGICLSTSQLTKVLGKIKDSSRFFHYRQLTDKEMTDSDIINMINTEMTDDLDYIKELALGNKALFETDCSTSMNASVDLDEMERLKNELDKSERCRQSMELKVAEIKEETEKSVNLAQSQAKEIVKLKEQLSEYRTKYHGEQDRGDVYKRDFEKLLRHVKDIDKLAGGLGRCVTDTLEKFTTESPKKGSAVTSNRSLSVESKSKSSSGKVAIKQIVYDLTEDTGDSKVEEEKKKDVVELEEMIVGNDGDSSEAVDKSNDNDDSAENLMVTEEVSVAAVANSVEDFELSKPSDYDMIILDEAE